jgi:hypothetical protein
MPLQCNQMGESDDVGPSTRVGPEAGAAANIESSTCF